ncbi:MAG: sulfite reductase (ferredoxin) [bacterium]|jgi:sulfite reductase (ferredoxin)
MLTYTLPDTLSKDIDSLENYIERYKDGKIHETAFKAKRVGMGVYQERGDQTHMLRIRCAGNILTPKQLVKIAEMAKQYGKHWIHVTTRAEIQIHGIKLDDIISIQKEIQSVGLSLKGGGGNTIRNIFVNASSGTLQDDVFDVQPYAVALTTRLIAEANSFELPRKFKITFSSLAEDAANCTLQDLGFLAKKNEAGEDGFEVWIAGGIGAKARLGLLLEEFIPANRVYHVAKALKTVFHAHGNRKNKNHNRIRFLVHDDLGFDKFKELYKVEIEKIYQDDSLNLEIQAIDNSVNLSATIDLDVVTEDLAGFDVWEKRYVQEQVQKGLYEIKLPLLLGDLSYDDCLVFEELLRPFGDNVLRCAHNQNFYIRNIPAKYLKNIFQGIQKIKTLSDKPVIYSNFLPCTGAQTCKLGINFPRPATEKILGYFDTLSDVNFDLLDEIKVHISGCPNSCATHWIGDLGFFGKVRRVGGKPVPTYNVLGGSKIKPGETKFGEIVGWVHSYDLPEFLQIVLERFLAYQSTKQDAKFYDYWNGGGQDFIATLCKEHFNDIPVFEDDKNYYFDHGSEAVFSTGFMGKAECSAGIYDMIDVDNKAIKGNVKVLSNVEESPEEQLQTLKDTVFFASRMLLVTRGEEPKDDLETYNMFIKYFIESNLLDATHQEVIDIAKSEKFDDLVAKKDAVIALGKDITALYKTMDNTMKFKGEEVNLAVQKMS